MRHTETHPNPIQTTSRMIVPPPSFGCSGLNQTKTPSRPVPQTRNSAREPLLHHFRAGSINHRYDLENSIKQQIQNRVDRTRASISSIIETRRFAPIRSRYYHLP